MLRARTEQYGLSNAQTFGNSTFPTLLNVHCRVKTGVAKAPLPLLRRQGAGRRSHWYGAQGVENFCRSNQHKDKTAIMIMRKDDKEEHLRTDETQD